MWISVLTLARTSPSQGDLAGSPDIWIREAPAIGAFCSSFEPERDCAGISALTWVWLPLLLFCDVKSSQGSHYSNTAYAFPGCRSFRHAVVGGARVWNRNCWNSEAQG